MGDLPAEAAGVTVESHQDAPIARRFRVARSLVVRSHDDQIAGDRGAAVGDRSEFGRPENALPRSDIPGDREILGLCHAVTPRGSGRRRREPARSPVRCRRRRRSFWPRAVGRPRTGSGVPQLGLDHAQLNRRLHQSLDRVLHWSDGGAQDRHGLPAVVDGLRPGRPAAPPEPRARRPRRMGRPRG